MDFTLSANLAELHPKTREFISVQISCGSGLIRDAFVAPVFTKNIAGGRESTR